jgi:hypothetical protein
MSTIARRLCVLLLGLAALLLLAWAVWCGTHRGVLKLRYEYICNEIHVVQVEARNLSTRYEVYYSVDDSVDDTDFICYDIHPGTEVVGRIVVSCCGGDVLMVYTDEGGATGTRRFPGTGLGNRRQRWHSILRPGDVVDEEMVVFEMAWPAPATDPDRADLRSMSYVRIKVRKVLEDEGE